MSQNPHTAFPLVRTLGAVAVLLGLVACAAPRPEAAATANLQSTRGNTASGTVRFVQTGDKVQVTIKMQMEFEGKFRIKALHPSTYTVYCQLDLETDYAV